MTSQVILIELFDKACEGEVFGEEEMRRGNVDTRREHAIPHLDLDGEKDYTPGPQLVPAPSLPTDPTPPPNCTWSYISFSAASLAALKDLAVSTLPSSTEFISTDDVITAFIWLHITRARLPNQHNTTKKQARARAREKAPSHARSIPAAS
ncbi:hypothetical protein CVT25_011910 [Psilocybe cyanescens]|uniref:Uncharacterized protein n=1 Tax=Psilocybe cyanescens TaxID=93625 RepID=A0A409X0J6_PSICY|nr:hypothetical protein CVT25_011910 [Psilocybe cyanescens]